MLNVVDDISFLITIFLAVSAAVALASNAMFVPFTDATVPRIVLLNICTPPTVVSEPTPSASSIHSISPATSLPSTELDAVTLIELVSEVTVNEATCSVKF